MMLPFGKKYKKRLKEELKKELLEEYKKEELKKQQQEAKKNKQQPPKHVENSKEDMEIIRQKLFYAVVFVVSVLIALFVYLCFGFDKTDYKNLLNKEPAFKDPIAWKIEEFPNGTIQLNNQYASEFIKEIEFKNLDYTVYDVNSIYEATGSLIANMRNEQILYLLGRTMRFNNYISNFNFDNEHQICYKDGVVELETSRVQSMINKEFNIEFSNHTDFYYEYYGDESSAIVIKFIYENGKYYSKCVTREEQKANNLYTRVENRVTSINKKDDILEFFVNVTFYNKGKYYKDYLLTDEILNPTGMVDMDYILYGSKWKYTYKLNEQNNYYLYSIEKITETQ